MQERIVDFRTPAPLLHDWVYDIITAITFDRDYAYLSFYRTLAGLLSRLFGEGGVRPEGEVAAAGIKSDWDAVFSFTMTRRLNYVGLNDVTLHCRILEKATGRVVEEHTGRFELSLGQSC